MFKVKKEELKRLRFIFLIVFLLIIALLIGHRIWQVHKAKEINDILKTYAPDGVLIYGADDSAPPLRYRDESGQYKGVVIDFMNLISLELGLEVECKPYIWEDALKNVSSGKVDICDMFKNPERAKSLAFTDPLYTLRTVMVCNASKPHDLKEINRLRIATQRGDYANWYLKQNYPDAKLVYVHDVGEGLDFLMNGKVDAAIGDEPVIQYYSSQKGINDRITSINTALYEEEVVLAVPKNKSELVKPLNHAIKNIREKGQSEKIQQRWFGISTPLKQDGITRKTALTYILAAIAIALLAVAFKLMEIRTLKSQVKKRTNELEESRNEMRLMINEIPECIIIIDYREKIINLNKPAALLVCKDFPELKGLSAQDYFNMAGLKVYPKTLNRLKNKVHGQIKITKGNSIFELNAFDVSSNKIKKGNTLITIKDITFDEIKANQLLQSSKMIAIGQLAGGMAHELRNPLGIIRTQSYILKRNEGTDEKTKIALTYIDESIKHAGGIIDNVMNFWRIAGSETEIIHLKEFILSIIELNEDNLKKKHIKTDISCPDNLILESSKESLKHIILNIIQNAIDAVEDSTGEIQIQVSKIDNITTMSFRDNGCGIEEKNISNLYNPFFTTKPPGKGTGLGLFVTYTEIEKLGGNIQVYSEKNVGTKFVIAIPDSKHEESLNEK